MREPEILPTGSQWTFSFCKSDKALLRENIIKILEEEGVSGASS